MVPETPPHVKHVELLGAQCAIANRKSIAEILSQRALRAGRDFVFMGDAIDSRGGICTWPDAKKTPEARAGGSITCIKYGFRNGRFVFTPQKY